MFISWILSWILVKSRVMTCYDLFPLSCPVYNIKREALPAQKEKKKDKASLPFFNTAQTPFSSVEEWKRLYEISDFMRKQDIRCKVERGRVIIPNVQQCVDPVPKLETDTLQIFQGEIEALENLNIVYTEPTMI